MLFISNKCILLLLLFLVGFEFSEVEPSALVQKQGGPCAVIAPVQAFLLKILVMDDNLGHCLRDVSINYGLDKYAIIL